jgi:BirA family biotin operon repressor/biotin-[acetyl-CoA-carboxylase] ligase
MNNLPLLTPAILDDYVRSVELPAGCRENRAYSDLLFRYGAFVASEIRIFPSLDRAMDRARSYITERENKDLSVASGSLILATTLTRGKGRFQRSWHAPPGGLWGCLILADTFLPPFRNILPLIPGIACCEAVQQEGAADSAIRWVNDVLIGGKKQAGFLIEGFSSPVHHEQYHLLGFGLNINNTSFPAELQASSTSLSQCLGRQIDLCSFALSFLAKMRWYIGLLFHEEAAWLARGGKDEYRDEHPILRRWQELSDTPGKRVSFGYDVVQNPEYEAIVTGIARDGGLILQHDDGAVTVEHSGEIRYC